MEDERTKPVGGEMMAHDLLGPLCGPPIEYPRGATLFRQDHSARTIFLIVAGLVKQVRRDADAREVIVDLRAAPSLVGSSSAVSEEPYVTTASALTTCTAHTIEASALRKAIDRDSAVSRFVHLAHAREVREHILRAGDAARPADQRLARLLGRFIRQGLTESWGSHVRLAVPLRQEEMGQMIGFGREHVSRLLIRLERRGLIQRQKHWIVIPSGSPLLAPKVFRKPRL